MQVIRPINHDDFAALRQIAVESGHGFTSLPVDDEVLGQKIALAEQSFNQTVEQHGDQNYLFVLEDLPSGEVIGTTAIKASVGLQTPIYHYRQGCSEQRSSRLNLVNRVETLSMCNDYTGTTEICTLFLRENFRNGFAGRLLSRVRFMFMAEHPLRFSDTIIAEMRGVSDAEGNSPFWQWLQTHFIDIDFPTIDYMMGVGDSEFIPLLMPKHPLYTSLLTNEAKAVIGQVHEKTKPALRLLQKEGFEFRGYVDLFDAGPTIESKLSEINTVIQSDQAEVNIGSVAGDTMYAICNQQVANFRATYTNKIDFNPDSDQVTVDAEVATALKLVAGDKVRLVSL